MPTQTTSESDFAQLPLAPALLHNLSSLGYHQMTPVQAQSLPHVLKGRDLIAQAQTGSGKTAAFGLGLLDKLNVKHFAVQALVLCPTRELADQVAKEMRRLARAIANIKILSLCGGAPFGPQKGSLEHGAHIIVGTPGRVEEHLRKGNLDLQHARTFVLDEADRMLDMGFQDALEAIASYLPAKRQSLLFSATFPPQIEAIARKFLQSPVEIKIAASTDNRNIEQHFYKIQSGSRQQALDYLITSTQPETCIVFCNTKKETDEVAAALRKAGIIALALHGDMEQKKRDQNLVCFANKTATVLVATDVAARGLDIEGLDLVINFHIARQTEAHVHRIGRTGRAGKNGLALTLLEEKERFKLERLEALMQRQIELKVLEVGTPTNKIKSAANMVTLEIDGGKKQKLRPGDILGALTADKSIASKDVGKIHIFNFCAYVAISAEKAQQALLRLNEEKLKGRNFRARRVRFD